MTSVLEATALGKRYRRTWALRDCSLSIPRGCVAALVGPNGAGKTTLLSLAVGLLHPTTGGIRVLGADPTTSDLIARTGFVAQDTPLYPDLTVGDHLMMGRRLNRGPMIWLTWRQHRGQIVTIAIGLLALAGFLFVTGRGMRAAFDNSGLAVCLDRLGTPEFVPISSGSNCVELGEAFAARFFTLRLLALIGLIVLPALLGMFLGAPVVARELEQGTHQLIWTQGASRRRWAVTKFAVLGGIVVLAGGLLAVGIDLWFGPLNEATGQRFTWLIFDQQGAVLAGYALFAFALGVLAGAVTRRTLRAMGIALLLFCLVRFGVAVWIRPHLAAQSERSYPVVATTMPNRLVGDWIIGGGGPGVGGIYDADGRKVQGGQTFCEPERAEECMAEYGRGAYNFEIYQPASRFWAFQAIETLIFVVMSVALLWAAVWWVRRRIT